MAPRLLIVLENEPYPYDRRVRQQAETLVAAGWRVTVIGPTGFGFDAAEEHLGGVRVLRMPEPPAGTGVLSYLREYAVAMTRLRLLIRRARMDDPPDVILACSPPFLVALALPRRGAGIVIDFDDLYPELWQVKFGRRGLLHRLLLTAEGLALRTADAVLAPNESFVRIAQERARVPPERLFVVGNGPDPERIFPVSPRPELRDGHRRLVLWVGMMSSQEGLEVLVEAAARLLQDARHDVLFALVGPGDARQALSEDAARRGIAENVVFPGRADDEELRAWMATADVCVSVDRRNPMNDQSTMTKVLEYMAMGRPVVQFPLGEMQRACGDATIYARDGDAADLAKRIGQLLDDRQLAEDLGRRARERALHGAMWPDQAPSLVAAVERARARSRACAG